MPDQTPSVGRQFILHVSRKIALHISKYAGPALIAFTLLTSTLVGVFGVTPAKAATNSTLTFQARLLQSSGALVADGNYNVEFKLYYAASGGTALWTETRLNQAGNGVSVKNGYLYANLGSVTSFPSIDWDQEIWLTMNVGNTNGSCTPFSSCSPDGEMSPRFKVTAVPYAFKAAQAANVKSADTSAASTNSSNVSITSGNASGATSNSGNVSIDTGTATGTTGTLLFGTTNASALTIGRAGVTTTLQGSVSLTGAGTALAVTNDATIGGTLGVTGLGTFSGGLTIATGSTFTNASSTLFTAINISDKAAGGNIGTAAATVDVATSFNVNQTTSGQSLTLPSPTVATSGRIAFVNNVGSASFTMYGNPIAAGKSSTFIWNGTSWVQTISFTSTGVDTIGALDGGTANANAASITGTTLYLQSASATYAGLVNTTTQTISGVKTFNADSLVIGGNGSTGATLILDDASGQTAAIYLGAGGGQGRLQYTDAGVLELFASGASKLEVDFDSVDVLTGIDFSVDTNSLFVDGGSDFVSVGSTSDLGGKLQVVGTADETQLLIRANGTQSLSNPLVLLQNSSGSELARINATTSSLFFGNAAGGSSASGANNTGIGASALGSVSTGTGNTTLGSGALASVSVNSNNTALGYNAGNLATGSNNIFVGALAGDNVTTGSGNIIIGYNLDASAAGVSNELRIGGVLQGDTSTLAAQFNGTLAVTTLGATDTSTFLCRNTSNQIATCSSTPLTNSLTDNITDAFDLQEGTNNYININTTNTSENISFGNATTNPSYSFLGTGTLSVAGATTVTGLTTLNGGLTVEAGDTFTFNGDAFTDLTGSGLTVSANALTVDATSATGFFRNGGNSFAGTATLGTNDANSLVLETNNQSAATIASGGATTFQNATNSTTAFRVNNAAGTSILTVDTTNALVAVVGSETISGDFIVDTNTLVVDSANNRIGINTSAPSADLTFGEGASRTINVLGRTTNAAGNNLTVSAGSAGTGAGAFSGGVLTLQGGAAAGTGNANGGNVILTGGVGTGTGVRGLVVVDTATYSASTVQNFTGSGTITQSNLDSFGTILISSNAAGYTATMNDPTNTTAGRLVYVTNTGSFDMTLSVNGGGQGNTVTLKPNTTATMVWNGADWTAAGASSSTDLQAAYNNTATSAGGAELILNAPGGSADGLTIRNNGTTPIVGGLLEVQTSIGSNLFTVNNNATEYATNGGAETAGASSSTFPSNTWDTTTGGTVDRYTTAGDNVATGQASVRVQTTTTNHGARNRISTSLTSGLTYTVSFAVRGATNFSTLQILYSPDGTTTGTTQCATTQTVTSGIWSRITCDFIASGTITSSNSILIRQTDATARTFYIDNLSINIDASATYAADGSVDNSGAFATNWTNYQASGTATVAQETSVIYDTSSSARVTTSATAGIGMRNNLAITPQTSTQYLVTFYARSSVAMTGTLAVGFLPAGGTGAPSGTAACTDYSTQTLSTSAWTKITCLFTTAGTAITNPDLVIYQTDATARIIYVDALSITLNTNNSNNVQVGGANKGGPVTLFTLDRSAGAPIADNNSAYLGSMYYDTVTGRIQCYEADGWGACGAAPDNIVNLNPEYAGAVLNGSGVGTMTADFCSNDTALSVNSSLCSTGQAKNYYRWTSPQATQQTYSIYVTYQLPATFNGFSSDDTVQLVGRVDSTSNASVTYEMYKSTGSAVTQCGTGETNVITGGGGSANTWYSYGINGNEATGCSFNSSSAGNFIIFKINLKANSNANAYVSTLSFTTTGR